MSRFETWSIVLSVAGIIIDLVVFGALLMQLRMLAVQIRSAQEATDRDHDRRRRQATFEYLATTTDPNVPGNLETLVNQTDKQLKETLSRLISGDDHELWKLTSRHFDNFEQLAAGIRLGVFDLDVLVSLTGDAGTDLDSYRPWIDHLRTSNRQVYGELEWLAKQLRARSPDEPSFPTHATR